MTKYREILRLKSLGISNMDLSRKRDTQRMIEGAAESSHDPVGGGSPAGKRRHVKVLRYP